MALSIEEAWAADDKLALTHAVLKVAAYGHGWKDDAPVHNECPNCYEFRSLAARIDDLGKEAK